MKYASLFTGGGGFDLAAEWMGWENLFYCENNLFCQWLLRYYWPNSKVYDDISKTIFTGWRGKIDVLSGGFPCQPFSNAGERLGEDDNRFLWPEMLRAIREIKPRWVVAENVYGLVTKKFERVFEEILSSLEAEGYEVQPYIIPASAVGAPHERYRLWIIAHANGFTNEGRLDDGGNKVASGSNKGAEYREVRQKDERERFRDEPENISQEWASTNTERVGSSGSWRTERQMRSEAYGNWKASWANANGGWPTVPPVCDGAHGLPFYLDTNAISFKSWSEESLKIGGNAIVPQIAFEIFKSIEQMNRIVTVQECDATKAK